MIALSKYSDFNSRFLQDATFCRFLFQCFFQISTHASYKMRHFVPNISIPYIYFNSRFLQNATIRSCDLNCYRIFQLTLLTKCDCKNICPSSCSIRFQLTLLTKCDLGSLPDGLCRTAISTHASYKMRQLHHYWLCS